MKRREHMRRSWAWRIRGWVFNLCWRFGYRGIPGSSPRLDNFGLFIAHEEYANALSDRTDPLTDDEKRDALNAAIERERGKQ